MTRVVVLTFLISLLSLQSNGKEYKKAGSSMEKDEVQIKGFTAACQLEKLLLNYLTEQYQDFHSHGWYPLD
jgi:hypothetical protein